MLDSPIEIVSAIVVVVVALAVAAWGVAIVVGFITDVRHDVRRKAEYQRSSEEVRERYRNLNS